MTNKDVIIWGRDSHFSFTTVQGGAEVDLQF